MEAATLLHESREGVLRQYGHAIGRNRQELVTPALVLDIDAAQRKIDTMPRSLREMGSTALRQHYKTHKSPELARRGPTRVRADCRWPLPGRRQCLRQLAWMTFDRG